MRSLHWWGWWRQNFVLDFFWKVLKEHLVIALLEVDLDIERLVFTLLFDSLLWFWRDDDFVNPSGFEKVFKFAIEQSLIDNILPFFDLLTPISVIQNVKHINAVLSDFKHLEIRIDLVLGLLAKLHTFFLALSEGSVRVIIVEVCLFPEHPHEGSLFPLPLIFPIL